MFLRRVLQSLPFSERIEVSFGGKKAALRSAGAWILWRLGFLSRYASIDWERTQRLVFVCLGNICRSPYGEMLCRSEGLSSDSCGLEASPGSPSPKTALETAQAHGHPLDSHRATHFDDFDWAPGDLAIVFEIPHAHEVQSRLERRFPGSAPQVILLGLWKRPRRPHIQDPYSLGASYFDSCYAVIDASLKRLFEERRAHTRRKI